MWEERAYRARREIAALAASGLGVSDLHAEAIRVVGRDVKTELTCWATLDPEALVISMITSGDPRIPVQFEPLLVDAEFSTSEPHSFSAMAKRKEPLARMSDLSMRDHDRSERFQNVWRPLGLDQELRLLFDSDGTSWGAAGLVRAGHDFSARELEYLAAVAPAIATATRIAVRTDIAGRTAGASPAIVILNAQGEPRSATPEARVWEEKLNQCDSGRFAVMMRIMAQGAATSGPGGFHTRMSDGRGDWAVLQASSLVGGEEDGEVAVSIESVRGEQLTSMLLVAYGLSPRESDVCMEVMAGYRTTTIAQHLFVSPNTVQDHLKSAFAKVGVRSRGELVARLQPRPTVPSGK
ncbi:helix-turn-helix transcriptional regulator [Mycetocola zhadangensis]|uniref:LuxR family transcriptional regulator n=1 Tax=Mycetocola zhadangensis TaxID=1164595 RepID=A0A3L7J624_9MICO|nr:helix-turn-helix transcriptional regulator [Mycetocola zhadangensis]RLQ86083.1 LuxR family transcriptional regulator [Mycetocola zhadangensis]GGE88239.1 helix-turn-helix transcriptional regulator [Mycetocola zhadangensis]